MTINITFSDTIVRVAVEINGQIESAITELPKRPWKKLTEEERASFDAENPKTQEEWDALFNGIEAKLKEKNA